MRCCDALHLGKCAISNVNTYVESLVHLFYLSAALSIAIRRMAFIRDR